MSIIHLLTASIVLAATGPVLIAQLKQEPRGAREPRHTRVWDQEAVVYPNIPIHPNPTMQQFETSIVTHPSNPNIVLAAAVTQDTQGVLLQGTMGWYYTVNKGLTWSGRDTLPTHTNLNQWIGDPTVGIDLHGNLFVGGIHNNENVFVDRSTDNGVTWAHTVAYPIASGDHTPNLSIDTDPSSPFQGHIYIVSGGLRFSRSTDGGQSFSDPVSVGGTIGSWFKPFPRITVSPDSQLYATWPGYDSPSSAPVRLGFNRSTDRGLSWKTARSIRSYIGVYGQGAIKGTQIYSGPSIAVDRSAGAHRGWIYIVYAEKNPSTPDIFLIRSTDRGDSWSNAIKVNQDNSSKDHWMPAVSVDPATGDLFIVYYDSRNFFANDFAQVYVSASRDGGQTFQDILVSDQPFLPAPIRAFWDNDYMGQYIGITAFQGIVWPCWMDNRTGFHQVYTARIVFPPLSVRDQPSMTPTEFALEQNYPNPFNPSTTIRYSLPHRAQVLLAVYNTLGQKVARLVNESQDSGYHNIRFDGGGLSSGVYFYQLRAGAFVQTRKFIVLR